MFLTSERSFNQNASKQIQTYDKHKRKNNKENTSNMYRINL